MYQNKKKFLEQLRDHVIDLRNQGKTLPAGTILKVLGPMELTVDKMNDNIHIPHVLRRYGGKGRLLELYKEHIIDVAIKSGATTFVDCFGGGGTISLLAAQLVNPMTGNALFQKVIYNEKEPGVAALFRVLKSHADTQKLSAMILNTPYSRKSFEQAMQVCQAANNGQNYPDMELALHAFILSCTSFNSAGKTYRANKVAGKKKYNYEANMYNHASCLVNAVPLMRCITVEQDDYLNVLDKYSNQKVYGKVMFFLDPPYLSTERAKGARSVYLNEMDLVQHMNMANCLSVLKHWILCGYYSEKTAGLEIDPYEALKKERGGVEQIISPLVHRPTSSKSTKDNGAHEVIWKKP